MQDGMFKPGSASRHLTSTFLFWIAVGLLGWHVKDVKSIACLDCGSGENSLANCTKVTECAPNEACFVEKANRSGGIDPVFLAGCRDMSLCNIPHGSCGQTVYIIGKKRAVVDDSVTCSECCYQDFCNTQGCGSSLELQGKTTCFGCSSVAKNTTCSKIKSCSGMCYMSEVTTNTFRQDCITKQTCQFYNMLNSMSNTCCNGTLCNALMTSRNATLPDPCATTTKKTTPLVTTTKAAPFTTTSISRDWTSKWHYAACALVQCGNKNALLAGCCDTGNNMKCSVGIEWDQLQSEVRNCLGICRHNWSTLQDPLCLQNDIVPAV